MRRYIIFALLCLFLAGCSEKYDEGSGFYPSLTARYISVSPSVMSFNAKTSGAQVLYVKSLETPWKIENGIEWLTTSSSSGNSDGTVNVDVVENTTGDVARTGIFYVKSNISDWNYEFPISITQAGATPFISISKTEFDFKGSVNTDKVTVTSNCSWNVSSSTDWLTVSKNNNIITLSATSNQSNEYRTATISVIHSGKTNVSSKITVRQAPASITASTESLTFNNTASAVDVTINSETSWTASSSSSWIDISPTSGEAGTTIMKISVSPNTSTSERTGYVILSIGSKQRIQIPIRQRGIYVEVDKTSMTFAASGESQTINVSSNTNWVINDCPSWISVSKSSGNGDAVVTISAENNAGTNQRIANIKVTQEGLTVGSSITITQNGKTITVNPQSIEFDDIQSSAIIEITADDNWTVHNENSWISVSSMSGYGTSEINLSVTENETENLRNGDVYITMLDKTLTVKVSQKGKVFSAETDSSSLTFPAKGGNATFNINSNASWTLSGFPSWVSLSKVNGHGNSSIIVTAEENPNTSERAATMYLQVDGKEEKTSISLRQYSKSFTLSPTHLNFTDKSSSQVVNIETDGTWNATTTSSWILLSPQFESGNSSLQVTVLENTTDAERNGVIHVTMGDKTLPISVNQKGKYFTVSSNLLNYTSKGGRIGITITTNDSWTAYVEGNASWMSLSQTSGTGTVDINVDANDNPSVNKRTGYVVIETPHGQSVRVVVTQNARYLTIDHNSILFYAKGGNSEAITVSTDGTYSINCSDTWFTVNQSSNTFTVTASENTGKDTRQGTIQISLTDLKEGICTLSLTIIQLNNGGSFLRQEYGEDNNYDDNGSSSGNLTITEYGSDNNYDSNIKSGVTLSISGYKSDKNWDSSHSSGVTVTITGYNSDTNWDSSHSSSGNVSKIGYDTDNDWDN